MTLHLDTLALLMGAAMQSRSIADAAFAPVPRQARPSRDELLAIFAMRKAR